MSKSSINLECILYFALLTKTAVVPSHFAGIDGILASSGSE